MSICLCVVRPLVNALLLQLPLPLAPFLLRREGVLQSLFRRLEKPLAHLIDSAALRAAPKLHEPAPFAGLRYDLELNTMQAVWANVAHG